MNCKKFTDDNANSELSFTSQTKKKSFELSIMILGGIRATVKFETVCYKVQKFEVPNVCVNSFCHDRFFF